jgi:NAD(P)-dependent dehydrogenase (short-subunit alcohol dehydrogenase family)
MYDSLKGKIALVTGAGGGVGQGCAVRLAAEGVRVVMIDVDEKGGKDTLAKIQAEGGEALFLLADVSQTQQCRMAVQKTMDIFGGLDILVNNAGIFPRAYLEETTEEFYDNMLGINLKGPFFLCKYSVPILRSRGGGSIINTGSVHGLGGDSRLVAYAVSKGGLLTMTKNLAVGLAKDKIRVNYLIPGWVLSETERRIRREMGQDENWLKERELRLPMGRYQTPQDSANLVAFLASDDSAMITGCVINVDAGHSVRCIGADE